jgi:hypothetical protein
MKLVPIQQDVSPILKLLFTNKDAQTNGKLQNQQNILI